MINLPLELTPSELLCCEELPPYVDELLGGSRAYRRQGEWSEAERWALDAVGASQEPDARASQAVALIHLADVHRDVGRLGPALAACQQAYRIFKRQMSHPQRHNEAVAAYALGLVHQLLGSDMEALKWYQASSERFERVKDEWTAVNALAQVETCTRVQRWMGTLSEYLTAARTRASATAGAHMWVPVRLSEAEGGGFAIAELEIDQYTVGDRLMVDGRSFRVQSLKGGRPISVVPGGGYYGLEVPDEARTPLGASEGDYALVVRGKAVDREGPGVLETDAGPEFGDFKRDASGKINFIRTGAATIGGDDIDEAFQIGYVTGLLKPI